MPNAEGLPNAVLDGMAAANPIGATDAGGTREFVKEGVTGYLVPVGAVVAASQSYDCALQAPATDESMGESARGIAEKTFTIESITRRVELLYVKPGGATRT